MNRQAPPRGLLLPEYGHGGVRWTDDGSTVARLRHKVRHGDELLGWEGDETLDLYYLAPERRVVLSRQAPDGSRHLVRMWDYPARPDESLIEWLCVHDVQRGYDVAADVEAHNERLERQAVLDKAAELAEARERMAPVIQDSRHIIWSFDPAVRMD